MKSKMLTWMQGTVTVELEGGKIAEFLNHSLKDGIILSSIYWTSPKKVRCDLSLEHYFKLRKNVRAAGCKLRIINKRGFPFFLQLLEKRIWFTIGMGLFFTIIFCLSSLIWTIDIEGNEQISSQEIMQAAKQEGLFPLQWSFKLQDTDVIAKKLVNALDGVNWIGIEKNGTKVNIKVVEMTLPEIKKLRNPRHLVASADAVVTYIIAETGKPLVKKNSRVKKGQTLISGIIGSDAHSEVVIADGIVKGLVWYEYNIETPLTQNVRAYTGNKYSKEYIVIGNRALQISGFKEEEFEQSEMITSREQIGWKNWSLPIGKMKEIVMESRIEERQLSIEEAKQASIDGAKSNILSKAGHDAKVISEIILHEGTDNGKVVLKVLFEVEQSITKESPIVQMQGE